MSTAEPRSDCDALWGALVDLAPRGTKQTWHALAAQAPEGLGLDPGLVTGLSVSPPSAAEVDASALRAAATAAGRFASQKAVRGRELRIRSQGGTLLGVMLGLWVAAALVPMAMRVIEPPDLAKGKPWRASSSWGTCDPEHGICGPLHSRIFFHTQSDENPWVEIDLGKPVTFTHLTIINRSDEHLEDRAVPLVMEVGDDQQTWREIARRDEVFDTWKPRFAPVTARFIRARVARRSWLHLEAVMVHP